MVIRLLITYLELQLLQQLQQLGRLERLQISNISYEQYEHKDGDVVYCDIPYENTNEYTGGFNHKEFYEWCDSQPFPIYFSSYPIPDCKYKIVWAKGKMGLFNSKMNRNALKTEVIYRTK